MDSFEETLETCIIRFFTGNVRFPMKECIFGWLFYTYNNESLFVHLDKGYVLVRKEVRYLHLQ